MKAQMTRAELLDLPPAVDLETANRALGLGRTYGYRLAKLGKYPVRVVRLGNAYRAITSSIWEFLGVEAEPDRDGVPAA